MRDKQIEMAVIIVVKPDRAGCESGTGDAGLSSHVDEFSVAQIVKETAASYRRNVNVVVTVVVVVTDGTSQAVHFDCESGLASHIGERAVVVVVRAQERTCRSR